jgi:hypothetical protein
MEGESMKSKREVIRANTQLLSEIAKKSDQKIQVLPPDSVGGNVVDLGVSCIQGRAILPERLCLLKTPKGRESLEIFAPPPYRRGHDHNSFRPPSCAGSPPAPRVWFQGIQKSAIIHARFGVIWGMSVKEACHVDEQTRHRANAARGGDIAA